MKCRQVVAGDRLDRGPGPRRRREVGGTAHQPAELASLDARGRVVATLHLLNRLALGQRQPVVVEPGVAQHIEEQIETDVEILRQAVQVRPAGRGADVAANLRRQKRCRLVEVGRAHRRGAAGPQLAAGETGQPDLVRRVEIATGADRDRERDQRQFVVFDDEDDDTIRQLVPMVGRRRRRKVEQLVREIVRVRRNGLRRGSPGDQPQQRRHEHGDDRATPRHRPPPAASIRSRTISSSTATMSWFSGDAWSPICSSWPRNWPSCSAFICPIIAVI